MGEAEADNGSSEGEAFNKGRDSTAREKEVIQDAVPEVFNAAVEDNSEEDEDPKRMSLISRYLREFCNS